jgi:hypothetical protein
MQYIHNHGLSDPIESKDSDALLDLQNYPGNHTGGSLIPASRGPCRKTILITTGATAQLPNVSPLAESIFCHAAVGAGEIGRRVGFFVDHSKQIAAAQALECIHAGTQPPHANVPTKLHDRL